MDTDRQWMDCRREDSKKIDKKRVDQQTKGQEEGGQTNKRTGRGWKNKEKDKRSVLHVKQTNKTLLAF